jgi:hypothetical protein
MADRTRPDPLPGALLALADDLAYPPTPGLAAAVGWRLEAAAATGRRPPFPRTALWSRRRLVAVAAVGLLALLALAFGARFVLGAAEVRVQPGITPSGPPFQPSPSGGLGEPVPVDGASAAAGFPVALPAGPPPDEAYVVATEGRVDAILLAWAPSATYPPLPATPYGLLLLETTGDRETIVKNVERFEDLHRVRVAGRIAAWIDAPHELIVLTEEGPSSFSVEANVLIWMRDGVTYRLETALGLRDAIALAETIG